MDINIDQDGMRVSKSSTKQISDKAKKRKKWENEINISLRGFIFSFTYGKLYVV